MNEKVRLHGVIFSLLTIMAMVAIFCTACPTGAANGGDSTTTTLGSNETSVLRNDITSATTLRAGVYLVEADISVRAALILSPGTVLRFAATKSMIVENTGSLVAIGLPDVNKGIIFESAKAIPAAGDYYGLIIRGNSSQFAYCTFRHAEWGLSIESVSNTIVDHCIFEKNTQGLWAESAKPGVTITNNAFNNNVRPLRIGTACSLNDSNSFSGNTGQAIEYPGIDMRADNTANHAVSWGETEVPFIVDNDFVVEDTVTFTLAPGVTFVMNANPNKWLTVRGTLMAQGNATKKVVFTSSNTPKNKGDWGGLIVYGTASSTLEYCTIEYATTGIVVGNQNMVLRNSELRACYMGIDRNNYPTWLPGVNVTYSDCTTSISP